MDGGIFQDSVVDLGTAMLPRSVWIDCQSARVAVSLVVEAKGDSSSMNGLTSSARRPANEALG